MAIIMYTQHDIDIALLKEKDTSIELALSRIENTQKWMFSLMSSAFIGIFGLMAHGFKWLP